MFVSKMKTAAMLVLALGLLVGGAGMFSYHLLATAPVPKKKTDKENIQGTWTAVSAEINGKKAQPEEIKDVTVVITVDKITFNPKGENRSHNYKLDPTKTPKVIEITPLDGPAKGKPQQAIYELNGDRLKLCVQNGDGQPPVEFATKARDGLRLLILERVKK